MRTFILFLLSALFVFLHLMFAPIIAIYGAKPDFIMVSVIMMTAFTKKWYPPVLTAVYSGVAVDLITQPNTFVNTGIYIFFGICAAVLIMILRERNIALATFFVFLSVAVKHLMFVFLLYIMRLNDDFTLRTFFGGLPSALYSFAIAFPVYFLFNKLFSLSFMKEKKEDKGRFIS